jgi:hypothetical protein
MSRDLRYQTLRDPSDGNRAKLELDRRHVVEDQLDDPFEILHGTRQAVRVRSESIPVQPCRMIDSLEQIPQSVLGIAQHVGMYRHEVLTCLPFNTQRCLRAAQRFSPTDVELAHEISFEPLSGHKILA